MAYRALVVCSFLAYVASVQAQKYDPRYADRLYRDLVPHPDRVSRSGWLWNAEKPVEDGAASFFRLRFNLEDAVRTARLKAYFDDSGELFVNGERLAWSQAESTADSAALMRALRRGENILAVSVKNGKGAGGAIFLLEVELANGSRRFFHSDESVRASSVLTPGWENVGFDDAAWGGARRFRRMPRIRRGAVRDGRSSASLTGS